MICAYKIDIHFTRYGNYYSVIFNHFLYLRSYIFFLTKFANSFWLLDVTKDMFSRGNPELPDWFIEDL